MNSPEGVLRPFAVRLIDRLCEAKKAADYCDNPFERGRHNGFYLALVMLIERAKSAGIDLRAAGLEEIDPIDFL
jgi:hypothetical protein